LPETCVFQELFFIKRHVDVKPVLLLEIKDVVLENILAKNIWCFPLYLHADWGKWFGGSIHGWLLESSSAAGKNIG